MDLKAELTKILETLPVEVPLTPGECFEFAPPTVGYLIDELRNLRSWIQV